MQNILAFFQVLFNPSEATCLAQNKYGTMVSSLKHDRLLSGEYKLFSINPLHLAKDYKKPSSKMGRRADCNVTSHRNLLIEFDGMALEDQLSFVDSIGMPYSSCVFSGSKSYHFIISLEEPVKSKAEYKALFARIHKALGGKNDKTTSNPSRLSRFPQADRNGTVQTLVALKKRVSRDTLEEWLLANNAPKVEPKMPQKRTKKKQVMPYMDCLRLSTIYFLRMGAEEGEWNNELFKAACNMAEQGYTQEKVEFECRKVTGFLDNSDYRTITSAFSHIEANEA